MLAVFAGTGFYSLGQKSENKRIETKYGTANLAISTFMGEKVVFLARHGEGHTIPSHKINYRANVAALKTLDVSGVLAFYSAGILANYKKGDLVMIEDFINFGGVPLTLYDDFSLGIHHTEFTELGSKDMQKRLKEIASAEEITLKTGGIIATVPGTRFETPTEASVMKKDGANLINMTAGYEMTILQEAEVDFAAVAIGTREIPRTTKKPVDHKDILATMNSLKPRLEQLAAGFVQEMI